MYLYLSIIPLTKYRLYPWLYSWHKSGGFPLINRVSKWDPLTKSILTYLLDQGDDPALKWMIYIILQIFTITNIITDNNYNIINYHDLPLHILLQIITTYHYKKKTF